LIRKVSNFRKVRLEKFQTLEKLDSSKYFKFRILQFTK
jgi:hypothetical protein